MLANRNKLLGNSYDRERRENTALETVSLLRQAKLSRCGNLSRNVVAWTLAQPGQNGAWGLTGQWLDSSEIRLGVVGMGQSGQYLAS